MIDLQLPLSMVLATQAVIEMQKKNQLELSTEQLAKCSWDDVQTVGTICHTVYVSCWEA